MRRYLPGSNDLTIKLQSGSTLLIFIGILFLIMLLSIHIQDGNVSYHKFTHNLKDKTQGETNAHLALRYAQTWLENQPEDEEPEAHDRDVNPSQPVWSWNDALGNASVEQDNSDWQSKGKQANGNNSDALYIIEQISVEKTGDLVIHPDSGTDSWTYSYRITARGTSNNTDAYTLLQSTFTRDYYK